MKTFRRLLSFVLPLWPRVLLASLLGALTIGASISLMSTSAYLISMAALHPSIAEISVAVVGVRFFGIARGVFRYLERLASHSMTFKVLARLRVWFYQALEPLAPARLVSSHSGDLLNRVMADIETLDNLYVRVLAPPLVALIVVLAMAVFMGSFAPILGAVLTVFLLVVGLGLTLLSLRLNREPGRRLTDERSRLRTDLVDGIQGLPDLIAFGRENTWLEKIRLTGRSYAAIQTRMARLGGLQAGLNSFLMGAGVWLLLAFSIPLVQNGSLRGVYLAVIVLGAMASFEAVQNLPQAAGLLEANLQSARRLFELADSAPAVNEPAEALPRPAGPDLRVRGLSFAYEDRLTLDGVDFDLPAGKRMAIVGPSGAGKSTLVNLLMRFWEFSQGAIELDGKDIRLYAPAEARRTFSLVSQGTYLFNASLSENLRLAQPDAGPAEIEAACRVAGLHEFIESLPKGYETLIGERGWQLSGGERQRLAIARALLRDAPLLVLDEATANLDSITECQVLNAIEAAAAGRAALTITHRLAGLEQMDEILVLRAGQVVERGRHAGLLAQAGYYRRMWELQSQALE